jgi:hypothetical protein
VDARALLLDIETLPNIGLFWTLWNNYLRPDNILEERTIVCVAWKWLDGKQVSSASVLSHPGTKEYPDKGVIEKISDVLSSADAMIAHNGDKFDLKWIRGRRLIMGLPPMRPPIQIDTLKMAKKQGYFNSNRLEYLAKMFKVGEKTTPDYSVWKRAVVGDRAAIEEMVAYNRNDIKLLEGVYRRLAPGAEAKMNRSLIAGEDCCPNCGEKDLKGWGFVYTRAGRRQRLRCFACGHFSSKPLRGVIR